MHANMLYYLKYKGALHSVCLANAVVKKSENYFEWHNMNLRDNSRGFFKMSTLKRFNYIVKIHSRTHHCEYSTYCFQPSLKIYILFVRAV